MDRRRFVQSSTALAAFMAIKRAGIAAAQETSSASAPFSFDWLVEEAGRVAAEPFATHAEDVPASVRDLTYDQYRAIWFKPEAAIWADEPTQFRLDLFHLGFVYREPVAIALVEDGQATEIAFDPSLFAYGHIVQPPETTEGMGFSGFRARYPINTPDALQEFAVFQGASYFRAVGRDQIYGLSARGLAINTAEPEGEDFPAFRKYWIEKPAPGASTLVVYALLDSAFTTGAYRFEIAPGAETVMNVTVSLYVRQEINKVGIAPLTSMFMFDAMNRGGFEDYRPAVHDSDGLLMLSGAGEWIWRPLSNGASLQLSYFVDNGPRGFGLMQRGRRYEDYQDIEGRYESRPSLWIEPLANWGEGFVELVEIPSDSESNDNIVAYWRPKAPLPVGGPQNIAYRMRWTENIRPPSELLSVAASRAGLTFDQERKLFVIDFAIAENAPADLDPANLTADVSASAGDVANALIHARRANGRIRVSFELDPGAEELVELRLRLRLDGEPASETWTYRWTAE